MKAFLSRFRNAISIHSHKFFSWLVSFSTKQLAKLHKAQTHDFLAWPDRPVHWKYTFRWESMIPACDDLCTLPCIHSQHKTLGWDPCGLLSYSSHQTPVRETTQTNPASRVERNAFAQPQKKHTKTVFLFWSKTPKPILAQPKQSHFCETPNTNVYI